MSNINTTTTNKVDESIIAQLKAQADKDADRAKQIESAKKSLGGGGGVGTKVLNGREVSAAYYEAAEMVGELGLKSLQGKTNTLGTDADGGFLSPEVVEAALVIKRQSEPLLSNLVDIHPQTADVQKINVSNARMSVAYTAEDTAITESKPTFTQLTLTAYWLKGLGSATNELIQMERSRPAIGDYILTDMARQIGRQADNALIAGTGSNQPTGLATLFTKTSPTISVNTASTATAVNAGFTYTDLVNTLYAFDANYIDNMVILVRRQTMPHIHALTTDNANVRLFEGQGPGQALPAGAVGRLMGIPVFNPTSLSDNYNLGTIADGKAAALVFVNLREAMIRGEFAGGTRLATSEHAEFEKNNTMFRAVAPVSCVPKHPEAVAVLAYRGQS